MQLAEDLLPATNGVTRRVTKDPCVGLQISVSLIR
jgi:hypothetical protein